MMNNSDLLVPQGILTKGDERLSVEVEAFILDEIVVGQAPEREAFVDVLFDVFFRRPTQKLFSLGVEDA